MVNVDEVLKELTLDEKIGQLMCFDIGGLLKDGNLERIEEIAKYTSAGSFFVGKVPAHTIKTGTEIFQKYSKLPIMVAADVEFGPGAVLEGEVSLPWPMAWGACDDPELIEKAHRATAERCREAGIHWSFAPIADILFNMDDPDVNIRAISDDADQVIKIDSAAIRGVQKNGLMAAGCKHFPGYGVDDRNAHCCTIVNDLPKDEWMDTFGRVYKELIKEGAASIMVGHVSLPAYDEKVNEWLGYLPCCLSHNLMTKLLKGELGFDGCIVSDAMSMVGACAAVHPDRLSVEYIKAGGDMILFPNVEYFDQVKEAVLSGEISMERLDDAVRRVLKLKERARLFEDEAEVQKDITHSYDLEELSKEIAEKSITLIRNFDEAIPLKLEPGDEIVLVNLQLPGDVPKISYGLETLEEDLKARGFKVYSYINPGRPELKDHLETAKVVLVNIKICSRDYLGGTLRTTWIHSGPFWRGLLLRHPKCIFTSFGDPFKLYEFPHVKSYINVYSSTPTSQHAFVKALLGEIPMQGKSPVALKGFFDREV